jgi:hypothetical protein
VYGADYFMSQVTWPDVVNAVAAVLALFLAGLSLYLRERDNRPRLEIDGGMAYMPNLPPMASFTVRNTGRVDVTITSVMFVMEDGHDMAFPGLQGERSIPCRIAPGDVVRFWNPLEGVQSGALKAGYSGVVEVIPVVVDGLGNRYEADKRKLRVNDTEDS